MAEPRYGWSSASAYEDFMGRWSRRLAPRFLSWLCVPARAHWLDIGCGTGALTNAICEQADPASVTACDPSKAFVEYARTNSADRRVSFTVAGAGSLPRRAGGYGSIASLLVLNFIPDAGAAIREMRSLAGAGGMVSACVWDYAGGMELLRRFWDAAAEMDPDARRLDEGARFPICHRDALMSLFVAAGLDDVRCEALEIRTEFVDFDDYWRPLLGGTGPVPTYVASLAADRRATLARRLEQTLPRGRDGRIELAARAWAVRGTAP
jgi:SAM-dependent methyltransferase